MFETMYAAPGIGLAAIQVAQPLRLITMDLAKRAEDGESRPLPRVFINPEILTSSEETSVYEAGCLSIPEYYEEEERPAKVRLRFTDLDGKAHEEDAEGLLATCIHHEIDAGYALAVKPDGRGMNLQPTPVGVEKKRVGVPGCAPTTRKSQEAALIFRSPASNTTVVLAYAIMLPKTNLDAPKNGRFNLF